MNANKLHSILSSTNCQDMSELLFSLALSEPLFQTSYLSKAGYVSSWPPWHKILQSPLQRRFTKRIFVRKIYFIKIDSWHLN